MKLISWNINGFRSLMNRTLLEMDHVVHPCRLGIGSGCFHNIPVNIIALDIYFYCII